MEVIKITPRLKSKGISTTDTSSYRPVAVLTVTSKLVEKAAQIQLLDFMETPGQLNPSAHTYRKDHSTTTTLLEIIDEIHKGADDKKFASIMTVDQSVAFNSVDYQLLIQKLEIYNVGPGALQWISSYLKFRTQYVVVGRAQSEMHHVKVGVPQGSVIGPLLFAIFTNEMSAAVTRPNCSGPIHKDRRTLFGSQCSECGILTTYADDSTYTVTNKSRQNNQTSIRWTLDEIGSYLNDNRLVINRGKTSVTECIVKQKRRNYWILTTQGY